MTAPAGYPPVHISDEEMAVALNRLAGKSAMERAGYLMGWLAADVERHAAGLGSDPLTRQALALFRSNQYLNMLTAAPLQDDDLRDAHTEVKDGDKHDGYPLGGRW